MSLPQHTFLLAPGEGQTEVGALGRVVSGMLFLHGGGGVGLLVAGSTGLILGLWLGESVAGTAGLSLGNMLGPALGQLEMLGSGVAGGVGVGGSTHPLLPFGDLLPLPADGALLDLGDLLLPLPADGALLDLGDLLLPLPADGALLDLGEQVGDDPAGAAVGAEVLLGDLDDLGDLPPLRAWRTSPHLVRS